MQKQTIVLLLLALMALGAGAFLVPNLFREAPAPVMRWDADDEVDGVEEEQPEPATAETAALDRTEAALEPAKPQVTDDEARVDALLRGGHAIATFASDVIGRMGAQALPVRVARASIHVMRSSSGKIGFCLSLNVVGRFEHFVSV